MSLSATLTQHLLGYKWSSKIAKTPTLTFSSAPHAGLAGGKARRRHIRGRRRDGSTSSHAAAGGNGRLCGVFTGLRAGRHKPAGRSRPCAAAAGPHGRPHFGKKPRAAKLCSLPRFSNITVQSLLIRRWCVPAHMDVLLAVRILFPVPPIPPRWAACAARCIPSIAPGRRNQAWSLHDYSLDHSLYRL